MAGKTRATVGCREAYRVIKPGGRACLIGPVHPTFWLSRFFADMWMLFPTEEEYITVRSLICLTQACLLDFRGLFTNLSCQITTYPERCISRSVTRSTLSALNSAFTSVQGRRDVSQNLTADTFYVDMKSTPHPLCMRFSSNAMCQVTCSVVKVRFMNSCGPSILISPIKQRCRMWYRFG
jgi:hypothetical protein